MKTYKLLSLLILSLVIFIACDKDDDADSAASVELKIEVRNNSDFGAYLSTNSGKTLYLFAKDFDGSSKCIEGCENKWAPLGVSSFLPETAQNEFGLVRRADGFVQLTFRDWPLYTLINETSNEITGDNIDGQWYVAKPDYSLFIGVKTIDSVETKFLVNQYGQAVYYKSNDPTNQSSCLTDACIFKYPPLKLNDAIFPSVLDGGLIQTTMRGDSLEQSSYKDQPMYIHSLDGKGETLGQGFLGVWFVMEDSFF